MGSWGCTIVGSHSEFLYFWGRGCGVVQMDCTNGFWYFAECKKSNKNLKKFFGLFLKVFHLAQTSLEAHMLVALPGAKLDQWKLL